MFGARREFRLWISSAGCFSLGGSGYARYFPERIRNSLISGRNAIKTPDLTLSYAVFHGIAQRPAGIERTFAPRRISRKIQTIRGIAGLPAGVVLATPAAIPGALHRLKYCLAFDTRFSAASIARCRQLHR
jgi:hypothetical protein